MHNKRELIQAQDDHMIVNIDHDDEAGRAAQAAELVERLSKLNRKTRRAVIARAREQARKSAKMGAK